MATRIEGFEEASAALSELSRGVGMNVARRAILPAAQTLKDAAQAAAPELTGDYKNSYAVDDRPRGLRRATRSAVEVHVTAGVVDGVDTVGAAVIEYGTSDTPAFGTFRATADRLTHQMVEQVSKNLVQEVNIAGARAARKGLRR